MRAGSRTSPTCTDRSSVSTGKSACSRRTARAIAVSFRAAAAAGQRSDLRGGRRARRAGRAGRAPGRPMKRSNCCSASATRSIGRLLLVDMLSADVRVRSLSQAIPDARCTAIDRRSVDVHFACPKHVPAVLPTGAEELDAAELDAYLEAHPDDSRARRARTARTRTRSCAARRHDCRQARWRRGFRNWTVPASTSSRAGWARSRPGPSNGCATPVSGGCATARRSAGVRRSAARLRFLLRVAPRSGTTPREG